MKTGVSIQGGKVEKEAVKSVSKAVVTIFESAHKNRMDQETVRTALGLVGQMGQVHGSSISNSSFSG